MAIAQGINKQVSIKKQTVLGTAASGSGGQILRREQSTNNLKKDTYANNEIASHQQSTGKTHGLRSVDTALNGVLSAGTYSTVIASVLRKDFAATASLTGLALAVGGTAGAYTLTGTGLLVSGGFKIGDVIRISVATGLNADCIGKNLLITNITNTVITVKTLNGSTMTTGSGTAGTIALQGKKSVVPITGHTKDYWTVEDWQSDISQSEVYSDVVFGKLDIGLPSTGNATLAVTGVGLDRTTGITRILTSPTAETSSNPLAAINGILIVNGAAVTNITGLTLAIDGKAAGMGAVVGSNVAPDIQRGSIEVSGSFTAFYQDAVLSGLFDAATQVNLVAVIEDNSTASSDFVAFSLSNITLDGDGKDDGDKAIVRTYPFTARINMAGGAALANDQTILSVQDSLAV
jgi:hypothetical protein